MFLISNPISKSAKLCSAALKELVNMNTGEYDTTHQQGRGDGAGKEFKGPTVLHRFAKWFI